MYRWDIINHLIKQNNYKSYLEIGYYKGWSFDKVICEDKVAVDPNPSKDKFQQEMKYGSLLCNQPENYHLYKQTSDDFFKESPPEWEYDIIFIDGLHESQQVDRDIQNALKHLSPGGVIVMHDCNPSSYEMTTTGTPQGEWTGDVYRSFIRLRATSPFLCYVVDTDYGVGIVKPHKGSIPGTTLSVRNLEENDIYNNWGYFDSHRILSLGLISVKEFLEIETNEQTTTLHNMPA
jgi:hypothetical protein